MKRTIALLLILVPSVCFGHPIDDLDPAPLPQGYKRADQYAQQKSAGDVYFLEEDADFNSLSKAEKFLMTGLSYGSSYHGLSNWQDELFKVLDCWYSKHGQIPEQLTPEVIAGKYTNGKVSAYLLEFLKSPITGEYPRLDQKQFSRGDLFVKRLDDSEIRRIAQYDASLRMAYVDGKTWDPDTGEVVPVRAISEVFYIRVYGESGPLITGLKYAVVP